MKIISIAVIISLSLMLILNACSSDYTRTIEKNWNVSLPKADKLYFTFIGNQRINNSVFSNYCYVSSFSEEC